MLDWALLWDIAGRWHRYGSSVWVVESAARPMSVVDLGAARTRGVRSPLTGEYSKAVSKSWADGGGWGTMLSRASAERMSRLIAPGVVGVRGGRIHGPIPKWHKHLCVSGCHILAI